MKINIINYNTLVKSGYKLIIVVTLFFSIQISAQQKFTILLSTGINQQLSVEGLKLTFDNNGKFYCWQNGLKQDLNFASVGKIYFTNLSLPTKNSENISRFEGLKFFPNPTTGIINIEFSQNSEKKTEVSVLNLIGAEVFRKELSNTVNYQVDLSNQVNGIYFLKVLVDNQQYLNKIVLRKL